MPHTAVPQGVGNARSPHDRPLLPSVPGHCKSADNTVITEIHCSHPGIPHTSDQGGGGTSYDAGEMCAVVVAGSVCGAGAGMRSKRTINQKKKIIDNGDNKMDSASTHVSMAVHSFVLFSKQYARISKINHLKSER